MTKKESLLISAYTGTMLCKDFSDLHEFIEKTLGRPVFTYELASKHTQEQIKEKLLPEIKVLIEIII